ncbi:conserved Plasmodium protein, unknown function [Plasmodium knowlesi strain H]|uniref:Uncharacterized protein n=2 Tax=Plasmodium knowlesi TaxID=5850 RepID=A0A679KY21_PLAKH|nr:conserved Plasmodium protein, unknown function [Plasmodium knowlesi strain H]OTN64784.1 Uncharacterized protein PKNOH_S130201600 [Plasmodium knowlesi]CAA9989176.1 conserved Plasmodium protein, unknown function [Plasmodium knowlesi strain H]VVS78650.1 conserved Plasmodium protein, unknown function [Plasmodium knowlesi strain H]
MNKGNLLKDETEKAIVHFIVYLIGVLLVLCVYYNYIILKYYFYSLFWAFIVSIPLHHVKVKLSEVLRKRFLRRKRKTKGGSVKRRESDDVSDTEVDQGVKIPPGEEEQLLQERNPLQSMEARSQFDPCTKKGTVSKYAKCKEPENFDKTKKRSDFITQGNASNKYKKKLQKLLKNVKKELDIYVYLFHLLIKPIYKRGEKGEKKENFTNHLENYEQRNASEIYFFILHRLILFYILREFFFKYKEFLFTIGAFIYFIFFFYKILKAIWIAYFYSQSRKYYTKWCRHLSFDYVYFYKHHMNDLLTVLIIIFSIIIFSAISILFIVNIYGESLYIINSINGYLSANFRNAAIFKNFRKFYHKPGKGDIEDLYELVNLNKVPFLSNKTLASISGHLKRAFDIYNHMYENTFLKNGMRHISACCLPLLLGRLALLVAGPDLSSIKRHIFHLSAEKKDRKFYLPKNGEECSVEACLNELDDSRTSSFSFKKLLRSLSQYIFLFSSRTRDSASEEGSTSVYYSGDGRGHGAARRDVFKTIFGISSGGNSEANERCSAERGEYCGGDTPKTSGWSNPQGEHNNGKLDGWSNPQGEHNNGKLDGWSNPQGEQNKEQPEGWSTPLQHATELYDPQKEKNFKFKEFIGYLNNLFSSIKKIEDVGKLTKHLIFNNSYGLIKIMLFFLLIFFNFFMYTFDAIIQGIIFFTALYYLISSKKSALSYVNDILLVVDPSSIFFYNITMNLKAIITCTLKRVYFYTLYIWLVFSFFEFPIIYVPTLGCIILSLIPIISPEIVILVIVVHLWIIQKRKIMSSLLFAINFFVYLYFTTSIYAEIPHTHAWLVSLSLFLSISTFGSKGLILGPLIGSIPLILHQIAMNKNRSTKGKKRKRKSRAEKSAACTHSEHRSSNSQNRKDVQDEYGEIDPPDGEISTPSVSQKYTPRIKCLHVKRNTKEDPTVDTNVPHTLSQEVSPNGISQMERRKTLLWKNKLSNLYKIIEINKNYIDSYERHMRRSSCRQCMQNFIQNESLNEEHPGSYLDLLQTEENKLALYIYKRDRGNKWDRKNNHNHFSKRERKGRFKHHVPCRRVRRLGSLCDNIQNNISHLFKYITSDS